MSASLLILGNPNSGKSLLFNKLTGLRQKVANYPGITVDIKSGYCGETLVKDFPGLYSLDPMTKDEKVATEAFEKALAERESFAILYIADGTRLERSLYLLLQVLEKAHQKQVPVIVGINMIDEVLHQKSKILTADLSKALGVPICEISAKKNLGLQKLYHLVDDAKLGKIPPPKLLPLSSLQPETIKKISRDLAEKYAPETIHFMKFQRRIDRLLLSSGFGILFFLITMFFLFQSIFTLASPLMDFVSNQIGALGEWTLKHVAPGIFADFLKGAIFDGVASVLVFTPQIFILFLLIGILEDSGYMARASILIHKPLSYFGLSGKSFVPLLSGNACAIPAIMAARTIESPRKRLITQLVAPLMTCSARLPVYSFLIAAFIPSQFVLGFLPLQGIVFFLLYVLSLSLALLASWILSKTLENSEEDAPFVLEMPPYRFPQIKQVLKESTRRSMSFIKKAGGPIFVIVAAIWALGYFPNGQLNNSWLAQIGQFIEPAFQPLGLDWKMSVAVLTSFLAREVFVGTLGTLYGLEGVDEDPTALINTLSSGGLTLATGIALLVFYAIALQCVSTLAVLKSETGRIKVSTLTFIIYSVAAYVAAFLTYEMISKLAS